MVTLDVTKAFDTVCYKRLLIKLDHHGIIGIAFKLIQSHLNNKLQYVCINNSDSNQKFCLIKFYGSTSRFYFRPSPISNLY